MSSEELKVAVPYPALVGQVISQRRVLAGLDQATLGEQVGVNQSTWSRIERGESALTMDQLSLAARALGTTPSEILREADKQEESLKTDAVAVLPSRPPKNDSAGLLLLGGVALTALLLRIASKGK